ncbi:DUF5672 family protein [Pontibacter beigongshangensis]|uniref:DUF5672 family protein n=1 Tax=Pontibacter beigongshangensis TaxID=2574733 RepID=UPI00164F1FAC|nr:DUF5672 family protein [Pontibacter beigongshangensis]
MNTKAVVVIPVHSETPSTDELLAFEQCYTILSNHDIVVVHPKGLDLSRYLAIVPGLKNLGIDPIWQSSLKNYNRLKCSYFFYSLFSSYDYLLTYELDAYIFRNELVDWCHSGYSYIGAPWFEGYSQPVIPSKFIPGGNSGFSLRNVQDCLRVLKRIHQLERLNRLYKKLKLQTFCSFPTFLKLTSIKKAFNIKDTYYLGYILANHFVNEDKFWSVWVPSIYTDFKVAPHHVALKFSFEVNPEHLYKLNHETLPFGCHAWLKYDKSFWLNYIPYQDGSEN